MMEKSKNKIQVALANNWFVEHNVEKDLIVLTLKEGKIIADAVFSVLQKIYELFDRKDIELSLISDSEINLKFAKSSKKYRKMYTSGCFDVFHYGHLNILEKTKELCDYLVVGVSTDELILKEKGRRPVIPFEERFRIIQSLGIVDEVLPQVDKNKQKIVDEYGIDAISVGDDWKGRFPKTTCNVEYLPYTKSVSSTILKDTLQLVES